MIEGHMHSASIITSPKGEKLALVPLADYERLLQAAEDMEDINIYAKIKQRLASGKEELIPGQMVEKMLEGENLVRLWRKYRGLSGKKLAEKAGVHQAFLSQYEHGKRAGTVAQLGKIATALGVGIDDLV